MGHRADHQRRRLVAQRRHLSDLPQVLGRRRRRRVRRHRRHPRPSAAPGPPRRRRSVVLPVVPLAAGRRRVRRHRLPCHRPHVRLRRRRRGPRRRRARPGHQGDRRRRAQPQLRPAPILPGGAGQRARITGLGALPLRARGRRRRQPAQRLALRVRRLGLGSHPRRRGPAHRLVVPAPVRLQPTGPELGAPRRACRVPRHVAVLVRPRDRRVPHRRGPRPGEGHRLPAVRGGRGPALGHPRRGSRHAAVGPAGRARDLARVAPRGQHLPPASRVRRRGVGLHPARARRVPAPRRAAHRLQLPLPEVPVGRPRAARG